MSTLSGYKRVRNGTRKRSVSRPETTFCATYAKKVVESIKSLLTGLEPVNGKTIVVTDDGIHYADDPVKKYIYNYAVLGEIQNLLESIPVYCTSEEISTLQTIFLLGDDEVKEKFIGELEL